MACSFTLSIEDKDDKFKDEDDELEDANIFTADLKSVKISTVRISVKKFMGEQLVPWNKIN
ncbi:23307_t:CDS:2 [Gigaspora rosea]|nr:23307_t:CDS:2 [Gigaspora rosea]